MDGPCGPTPYLRMVSRMTSPTATARSFQKSPSMSCSCSVRFVICYCLCCGLTDMRQSSTTASHTSDTTAVTAYSTAIKANTFHMVCSCLRNSESVLGPHGGGPLCLLQQAFQPIHQHVYIVWFGRDKHGVSFHMQVKSGLGQWDKALAFSLGNAPTTVGWPNHG